MFGFVFSLSHSVRLALHFSMRHPFTALVFSSFSSFRPTFILCFFTLLSLRNTSFWHTILFKRALLLSHKMSAKVNSKSNSPSTMHKKDARECGKWIGLVWFVRRNTVWIWFDVQSCDASLSPKWAEWMGAKCELILTPNIPFHFNPFHSTRSIIRSYLYPFQMQSIVFTVRIRYYHFAHTQCWWQNTHNEYVFRMRYYRHLIIRHMKWIYAMMVNLWRN